MKRARLTLAAGFAVPICVFICGAFFYWFAVADRYSVFLYGHLNATPFDAVTVSRYWMSGLVASGVVMIGYAAANWLLGRLESSRQRRYHPPEWQHVWMFCLLPLTVGIPFITISFNRPVLPPGLALVCLLVAWTGLAFALMPGALAAERPVELAWLALDGLGLVPCLLLLKVVELPARGIFDHVLPTPVLGTVPVAYMLAGGAALVSAIWLSVMALLRKWRKRPSPGAGGLLAAGVCISYLLMPVVHYLLEAPAEYRYISAASNFFAFSLWVQALVFLAAALLAWGSTRFRRAWHI